MRFLTSVAFLALVPALAQAQQRGAGAATPKPKPQLAGKPVVRDVRVHGWIIRPDRDNTDMSLLSMNEMKPGWHIITGPVAAIFYRPADTVSGNFTATLKINFFGQPGQHLEGYGLIVGGKNLEAATQTYTYFLVRNDGTYLIKQRNGGGTKTILDWTPSQAIKKELKEGNVLNVLRVEARKDDVKFFINDALVTTQPRSAVAVDGRAGFRINHFISAHVTELTIARLK